MNEQTAKQQLARFRALQSTNPVLAAYYEREHPAVGMAERAERELSELNPERRAAIIAVAGDDAVAQLRAIVANRPLWANEG